MNRLRRLLQKIIPAARLRFVATRDSSGVVFRPVRARVFFRRSDSSRLSFRRTT